MHPPDSAFKNSVRLPMKIAFLLGCLSVGGILWSVSRTDFVLFHTLIESLTIFMTIAVALAGWKEYQQTQTSYFGALAVLFLCVSLIDFTHTITYQGFASRNDLGPNPPTQFWILGRYIESFGLLIIFTLPLSSKRRRNIFFFAVSAVSIMGVLAIYPLHFFPTAFIEGQGLTLFKIQSEFLVILALLGAIWGLIQCGERLYIRQRKYFIYALLSTILAELCFTQYVSVYGGANAAGHMMRLIAHYYLFRALLLNRRLVSQRLLSSINLVAIIFAVMVSFLFSISAYTLRSYEQSMFEHENTVIHTRQLKEMTAALQSLLDEKIRLLNSVSAFVSAHPYFTSDEFATYAGMLSQSIPAIKSVQLAPKGILTYVTHRERHGGAIGHDLLADSKRKLAAFKAIQEKRIVVDGPVDLIQGGRALIARQPIFLNETKAAGADFWGFSIILIDLPTLMNNSAFSSFYHDFDITIKRERPNGEMTTIYGSGDEHTESNLYQTLHFANQVWSVHAYTRHNHLAQESRFLLSPWYWPVISLITLIIFIAAYKIFNFKFELQREVLLATNELQQEVKRREISEANERHLATHDTLTDLPNRRLFIELTEQELNRCKRDGSAMSILFMDLDGFKVANDKFGHSLGDELLKHVASRIHSCLGAEDIAARIGGDEFVVALLGDMERSIAVAEHILDKISKPFSVDEKKHLLGISIGVAVYPYDGITVDSLLAVSDKAMYEAKQKGKNRIEISRDQRRFRHLTQS
ncbi:sensor domain-containing diguanylate cyclase [Vibrio viridaestus]|uniref:Sensor domain-containing diguanylate cyclase n=1 Tax=Vibrio viridaestus TaxID=2487322 RepID=A0A3N9TIZ9_9VIBR|nr:sensor domain-containing diguanylate cyclase [Vibrio viridaestus]RQW64308.1 sensor domain-containing diguanylate cyclase [Vibrio viridaestus]